jgi:pimeloyl-ACP methyl ester carboxylesterase
MALVGVPTALAAVLLVVLVSAATVLCWNRLPGTVRWPGRIALLGAGQFCAVLLTAVLVNDNFVFYQSWSELLGQHPRQSRPAAQPGSLDAGLRPLLYRDFLAGRGTMTTVPITGVRSGIPAHPALVYLPAQYGDPAFADRSFPVVELLSGFPGGPRTWVRQLHVATVLDGLIATGRAAPVIAVIPEQNVASPRDTECVNVVRGPQVDTYLSDDVRTATVRAFRASTSGTQWTVMGDSTGGYCAADLAFRHPQLYAAAVSIAGYDAPAHDSTTGDLFGGDPQLAQDYSPLWLLQHRRPPDLALLLISSRPDLTARRASEHMVGAARPPLRLSVLTLPRGGHNFATFAAEIPVGFSWLSRFVAPPLAPLPEVDGLLPRTVSAPPQPRPCSAQHLPVTCARSGRLGEPAPRR